MGRHLFLSSVITAAVFLQRLEGRMIGSLQPIVVLAGNDIILPCHLEPTADLSNQIVEWSRPGSSATYVHVRLNGAELLGAKGKSYSCRTELFVNELKNGNISLKLLRVKRSDEGTYKCSVPTLNIESFIEFRVGVVSLPITSIVGTKDGGVDLQCESGGWYPEPEVEWLDSEGHVLSAGPTETLHDPDGTFTVRCHVTVYQTATNRFTCRVQQQHISQTRETVIHVPVQTIISEGMFLYIRQEALDEQRIFLQRDLADRRFEFFVMEKDLQKLEDIQKNQEKRIKKLINSPQPLVCKKEETEELVFKEDIEALILERKNRLVILKERIIRLEEREKAISSKKEDHIAVFRLMRDKLYSRMHGYFAKRNQAIVKKELAKLKEKESLNSATKKDALKDLEDSLWRLRSRAISSDARPGVPAMSVDGRGARRSQDEELKEAAATDSETSHGRARPYHSDVLGPENTTKGSEDGRTHHQHSTPSNPDCSAQALSAEGAQHCQGHLPSQPQTVCPPSLWEALQEPPF